MVAREGIAPPTSVCRTDMILFHHRAEIGCRGWNRTRIRAFKGRCPTIRRPGNWWPARVTRPVLRIKSPLHHFNACRPKNGARDRIRTCTGDALDVVSLLIGLHERKLEPPPGVAPSWLPYQRSASLKMLWEHETGVPDRLRSGDLLLERQACWLDYTTGTYMGTRNQTPGRSLPPTHTQRLSRSTIK